MTYPRDSVSGYKCDKIDIYKFERDQGSELQYTFYGMFPVNLSSLPVQYGNSDTLRMNVTFSYERYIKNINESKQEKIRTERINAIVDDYGRTEEDARRIVNGGNEILIGYD